MTLPQMSPRVDEAHSSPPSGPPAFSQVPITTAHSSSMWTWLSYVEPMPSPSWSQETLKPEGLDEPDGFVSLPITLDVLGMICVSLVALFGQPLRNMSTALPATGETFQSHQTGCKPEVIL